jgi:tRNA U34 2-thiouridine synthase MnmA/TrmU
MFSDIYDEISKVKISGETAALATVVAAKGSTPRSIGTKMLVLTRFSVKIRSSSNEAAALVSPWNDKVRVHLDSPQLSITPGQTAVFYQNDRVVGGGIIDQTAKQHRISGEPIK